MRKPRTRAAIRRAGYARDPLAENLHFWSLTDPRKQKRALPDRSRASSHQL